jgi:hypothetical protein
MLVMGVVLTMNEKRYFNLRKKLIAEEKELIYERAKLNQRIKANKQEQFNLDKELFL